MTPNSDEKPNHNVVNSMKHKMRDGKVIEISEMGDQHLLNTIKLMQRKASSGVTVHYGGGGPLAEDMWYDEEIIKGDEALESFNYNAYVTEEKRRRLKVVGIND